jgi:hypothetical protein
VTLQSPKFTRRIAYDVAVLVAGAVIMIATALVLEPTGDGIVQRVADNAQSTGDIALLGRGPWKLSAP